MNGPRPSGKPGGAARARRAAGALIAAIGALAQAGQLGAQATQASASQVGGQVRAVLEQVAPDQRLRLQTGDPGARMEGRYAGTEGDRLALLTDSGLVRTPLGAIDRLWTRGRSTGRGALIGGAAGLALGATYGALISEVTCAESSCTALGLAAAVGGLGAAGGAAVGALVGLAIPSWKLRYP